MAPSKQEPLPHEIDLNQIFIARDTQLAAFCQYLNRWKQQMLHMLPSTHSRAVPAPDNKIQGLVVLLSGDGGLGKSMLLRHYHELASESQYHFHVGSIINWESSTEEIGSLFDPLPGQPIDVLEYFKLLHKKLAWSLERRLHEFRDYKDALKSVEKARQQANAVVTSMQKEDRYATLRWLSGEIVVKLMRWLSPHISTVLELDNEQVAEKVKEYVGKGAEIGVEQLLDMYTKIKARLGDRLDDYVEPSHRLGLALGRDLSQFARNYPILLFFDTTEKVNKGEHFLRIIMGAAGNRVGWVMAGRDSLLEITPYTPQIYYGYEDIVFSDRLLSIHFLSTQTNTSAADVHRFNTNDILHYFARLRKQKPPLPVIHKQDAVQIQQITQGVPLAVRLAAGLYVKKPDLRLITDNVVNTNGIIHQMVQRYLRYAPDDQNEREQLYGLALLRRAEEPQAVIAALGLATREQENAYEEILRRLQWHYSFIFTEQGQPALHSEVRYFLRLWLLEHRKEPDKAKVIVRIKEVQQKRLDVLERQRRYQSLEDRLGDDEWVETYLDLIEALFWFDIVEGVRYSLTFMLASAVCHHGSSGVIFQLGAFFAGYMQAPTSTIWKWGELSLQDVTSNNTPGEMLECLLELEVLMQRKKLDIASPLASYTGELEAILEWRLGEAYLNRDENTALDWYQKAFPRLQHYVELRGELARVYAQLADTYYSKKEHRTSIYFLDEAIQVKYDYVLAYYNRGNIHYELKEYRQAIYDYRCVIALDETDINAYINLGNTHFVLKEYTLAIKNYDKALLLISQALVTNQDEVYLDEASIYYDRANAYAELAEYQQAIQDFDHALTLKPTFAWARMNRGNAYAMLREYPKALADYNQAAMLNAKDINITWMATWANFNKKPIGNETAALIEEIASLAPSHYVSYICKGIAQGLEQRNLEVALATIAHAIVMEPEQWDPYFWQGMTYAYLGRTTEAENTINKALAIGLPPLLLTPLYWLEKSRPNFFKHYAQPLLNSFAL